MDYSAALRTSASADMRTAGRTAQPLDASALDPDRLGDWLAAFHWPVADADFDTFARACADAFAVALRTAEKREAALLLADFGFLGFLLQHLHLRAAQAGFRAKGEMPLSGAIVGSYLVPDWGALGEAFDKRPGAFAIARLRLRGLAKSWVFNRHLSFAKRLRALHPACAARVLGSYTPLMSEYEGTRSEPVRYVYAEAELPRAPAVVPVSDNMEQTLRSLLATADAEAQRRLGVGLEVKAALQCWTRRLAALNGDARAVRARDRHPERLLLANMGNPLHRLLSQVWRQQGTEVFGFHHGNEMGVQPNLLIGLTEHALCDVYVAPTPKSAQWLGWRRAGSVTSGSDRIVSAHTRRLKSLRDSLNVAVPARIERVMVVGFPLSWIRYPGYAGHYALQQLDLEMRLVDHLKAASYRVVVKVHPEWQRLSERLWRGHADEVLAEPFERVWQTVDALVFPRISSTSFGYALCTDRPIVALEPPEPRWNAEARQLIERRCRMVPTRFDEDNRLRFDGEILLAALSEPPDAIDYAYVDVAMSPHPDGDPP